MTSNTLSTSGIQCPESSREPCYPAGGVAKQSWALLGKQTCGISGPNQTY